MFGCEASPILGNYLDREEKIIRLTCSVWKDTVIPGNNLPALYLYG